MNRARAIFLLLPTLWLWGISTFLYIDISTADLLNSQYPYEILNNPVLSHEEYVA